MSIAEKGGEGPTHGVSDQCVQMSAWCGCEVGRECVHVSETYVGLMTRVRGTRRDARHDVKGWLDMTRACGRK
ncbi:hypothetical protein PIB30_101088, partial [Stylosanthes scabra]|nr:hypothetical protein [Stylosanthes scabra]